MKRILYALFASIAVLSLSFCSTKPQPEHQPEPVPQPEPQYGTGNIVGQVICNGAGVSDVVVSDGYITTVTDANGLFSMDSYKKHGYVFISIPDGYEVQTKGILPQFHSKVGNYCQDTAVFKLNRINGKSCKVFVFGDMHLADRRRDLEQFGDFVRDVNRERTPGSIALTLGDMTWDAYWDGFDLDDYVQEMNEDFDTLRFFHTIGNHDHDLSCEGDWETAVAFKEKIGPTYYSFNRTGVHFIVLDDIVCTNSHGERSSYNKVSPEQIDWIKKDLSYVDKSTTVVIALHAPLYSDHGKINLTDGMKLINCCKGYDNTYFLSGHTHTLYNNDMTEVSGYVPVFESTCGAVCGAWWYTAYDFPKEKVHICSDGTPGGYKILEINDGNISWHYKGTGCDDTYQFRTYDRNCICIDESYVPDATPRNRQGFLKLAEDYSKPSDDNIVYINVWDYDPEWKISVKESGRELKVTQIDNLRDPMYLISNEAYSFNHGYTTEYTAGVLTSYYPGYPVPHMFKVRASSATSTLEIKVTDRFGKTYTESMHRPKELKLEY